MALCQPRAAWWVTAIERLRVKACPFANLPEKKGAHRMDRKKMREVRRVKPKVILEIAFNEMTVHGHLRTSNSSLQKR